MTRRRRALRPETEAQRAESVRALQRFCVEPPTVVRDKEGRASREYVVEASGKRIRVSHDLRGYSFSWESDATLLDRLVARMRALETLRAQLLPRAELSAAMLKPRLSRSALATLAAIADERERELEGPLTKDDLLTVATGDGRRIRRLVDEVLRLRADNKQLKTKLSRRT